MAILYTNARDQKEKTVDIIVSSSILDNIENNFVDEFCERTGREDIQKERKKDFITTISKIYPNKEYGGRKPAKNFEKQLKLIRAIRNELAHDERFFYVLCQDWTGLRKMSDAIMKEILKDEPKLDIGTLHDKLCDQLSSTKEEKEKAVASIHELSVDVLYELFNRAFEEIRTFIEIYRYDGPERDEYLFGIDGGSYNGR